MQRELTSIKSTEIAGGDELAVMLASHDAMDVLTVERLLGTVTDTTPKALRIQFEARRGATRSLWLPRRALVHVERDRVRVRARLARWWCPDDYQTRILDACRHTAGARTDG